MKGGGFPRKADGRAGFGECGACGGEDGKFLTSSGVSAGTDKAHGHVARMLGRGRAAGRARSRQ